MSLTSQTYSVHADIKIKFSILLIANLIAKATAPLPTSPTSSHAVSQLDEDFKSPLFYRQGLSFLEKGTVKFKAEDLYTVKTINASRIVSAFDEFRAHYEATAESCRSQYFYNGRFVHFPLSDQPAQYLQADRRCKASGNFLPEPTNEQDRLELAQYLLKNKISSCHLGHVFFLPYMVHVQPRSRLELGNVFAGRKLRHHHTGIELPWHDAQDDKGTSFYLEDNGDITYTPGFKDWFADPHAWSYVRHKMRTDLYLPIVCQIANPITCKDTLIYLHGLYNKVARKFLDIVGEHEGVKMISSFALYARGYPANNTTYTTYPFVNRTQLTIADIQLLLNVSRTAHYASTIKSKRESSSNEDITPRNKRAFFAFAKPIVKFFTSFVGKAWFKYRLKRKLSKMDDKLDSVLDAMKDFSIPISHTRHITPKILSQTKTMNITLQAEATVVAIEHAIDELGSLIGPSKYNNCPAQIIPEVRSDAKVKEKLRENGLDAHYNLAEMNCFLLESESHPNIYYLYTQVPCFLIEEFDLVEFINIPIFLKYQSVLPWVQYTHFAINQEVNEAFPIQNINNCRNNVCDFPQISYSSRTSTCPIAQFYNNSLESCILQPLNANLPTTHMTDEGYALISLPLTDAYKAVTSCQNDNDYLENSQIIISGMTHIFIPSLCSLHIKQLGLTLSGPPMRTILAEQRIEKFRQPQLRNYSALPAGVRLLHTLSAKVDKTENLIWTITGIAFLLFGLFSAVAYCQIQRSKRYILRFKRYVHDHHDVFTAFMNKYRHEDIVFPETHTATKHTHTKRRKPKQKSKGGYYRVEGVTSDAASNTEDTYAILQPRLMNYRRCDSHETLDSVCHEASDTYVNIMGVRDNEWQATMNFEIQEPSAPIHDLDSFPPPMSLQTLLHTASMDKLDAMSSPNITRIKVDNDGKPPVSPKPAHFKFSPKPVKKEFPMKMPEIQVPLQRDSEGNPIRLNARKSEALPPAPPPSKF